MKNKYYLAFLTALSVLIICLIMVAVIAVGYYYKVNEGYIENLEVVNMELNEELKELRVDSAIDSDKLNQINMRNEGIKYQEEQNK